MSKTFQHILVPYNGTSGSEKAFKKSIATQMYIEQLIVNDFRRFEQEGDETEIRAAHIVSLIDELYSNAGFSSTIQITLSSQITFQDEDPWESKVILGAGTSQCPECEGESEISVKWLIDTFQKLFRQN